MTATITDAFQSAMDEQGGFAPRVLSKLQGSEAHKREGDFVHAGQKMGVEAGFRNVSQKWLDKTMSYEQGLEQLECGRSETEDIVATLDEMKPAVKDGGFVMQLRDGRVFRPTLHAIGQMGTWARCGSWYPASLSGADQDDSEETPAFEPDEQDALTLAQVFSNGFRRVKDGKPFLWRTRKDGTLRAMLTTEYARIDNRWFIETLADIIPGGRLSHWKGDQDTLYGNVLIPDTIRADVDSDYGGMLSVGNSEIGERRVSSMPSIFRAICQNGCIWGQEKGKGIRFVHRGKVDLMALAAEIRDNLNQQVPLLTVGIDRLLGLRKLRWDGDSVLPLFAEVARSNRLTKRQASLLLEGYNEERAVAPETARSLFGVVAAITRAGQRLKPADWVRFDELGGRLSELDEDAWGGVTKRAKSLKVKEVEAAYA